MPSINPEIMVWARETAGLTRQEAARKLGFRESSKSTAADKLAAIECGEKEPSRPQLVKMTNQYHRPLLTFYLSKPPAQGARGADFRALPEGDSRSDDALLDALIRDIRARQSMVRTVLEDEDEATPLPFIGARQISDGREAVLEALRQLLGVDSSQYRAQATASAAFDLLRRHAEDSGIFVLLKGDLGHHVTAIDARVFRGFSIADEVAPFVVINDQDARTAWSFTLLHETVHLLLGQTGVSGSYAESEVERFCNDVAGDFLLPTDEMDELSRLVGDSGGISIVSERISAFARKAKVSRTMVAYKAYRSFLINRETFSQLSNNFREEWRAERERTRAQAHEQSGGPNYYAIRRHRLGDRILNLVHRMTAADALSTSKAARILGAKPRQVQPLLERARSL